MEPPTLAGFIEAAHQLGHTVTDAETFLPALGEDEDEREIDHQRRDDIGRAVAHAVGGCGGVGADI